MKRLSFLALLLCLAAAPAARAQTTTRGANADSDSTLYRIVTGAFNEARLTARLELSSYRWGHRIPLLKRTLDQGRSLSPHLRPATIYLAGLVAGAEYRDLRFFGWYRFNMGNKNVGLLPSEGTSVRFENGDAAAGGLASPEFSSYGARVEYAPTVWKRLALGAGFSYHHRGESLRPDCDPECNSAIGADTTTDLFSLYVPARYRFGWGLLHAKAGMGLWGRHDTLYLLPGNLPKDEWEFEETAPRAWSAEVGAAVPVYSFMVRPSLHVRRLWMEGAYTETVGGLKLQVGLPF